MSLNSQKCGRLVHVIESASGGSLKYVASVCKILVESGDWDVTVVYSRRPESPKAMPEMFPKQVSLVELPMTRQISILKDIRAALKLRKILRDCNPSLVHLHSSKAGALGRLCAIRTGINMIYTPHGFAFFRTDISLLKRRLFYWLEYVISRICPSSILVGSDEECRQALRVTNPQEVRLIHNSVCVPSSPPVYDPDTKIVVTIGRLTAAKNPLYAIEVARRVQSIDPSIEFLWVGDGELRSVFEDGRDRHGVRFRVTGWLSADRVSEILRRSRVYLQTSLWEGLPFALLEGMAAARPIVATNIPAHRDVIADESTGALVNTIDECVERIIQFMEHPDQAMVTGRNAWTVVHNEYREDLFAERIKKFYSELATGH